MKSFVVLGAQRAGHIFDFMTRARLPLLGFLAAGVLAGVIGMLGMPLDMSFRPLFTSDHAELDKTRRFESTFGKAGFNELIGIVDVDDAHNPDALMAVADLANDLGGLPDVVNVRNPVTATYFDAHGILHAGGVAADLAAARTEEQRRAIIDTLVASPVLRRIVFGDGSHRVAVSAQFRIATTEFRKWRSVDRQFRDVVQRWSAQQHRAVAVTGYPDVEQVYAHEVLVSVLRSIGLLVLAMVIVLFAYFRRVRDVVVGLAGVTLAVPIVLGGMRLLGQPFSIVNSQVLTLVAIVGIAEALHHQQEYRRRREAGRDHKVANREAFSTLAWPALMTGVATMAGFNALLEADMKAIWSFGLCTTVGVIVVYLVNWIIVPVLIDLFYRTTKSVSPVPERSWTVQILMLSNRLVQRRPVAVVIIFLILTAGLGGIGISRLSVDQKVNEELPVTHPSVSAQSIYEHEFSGFLGPDLWIRPHSTTIVGQEGELTRLVNRLCAMPEVRFIASPLDLVSQPALPDNAVGANCHRQSGDLHPALAARSGLAGAQLQRLAEPLIDPSGSQAAVLIRTGDVGTAKSIAFARRVVAIAREEMPDAEIDVAGDWWLAQLGMRSLSVEMMLSAATALLLILPIIWFAIRDRRLFLAALVPTVLPVVAALGFMGLTGITVRIGTAMILAISLGLAADDTIHLSVRIRDRILSGSDPESAVSAVLQRTGRPASFSSYVLIIGFATMMVSSLVALQQMGLIAAFTMAFALLSDLVLGPAIFVLLSRRRTYPRGRHAAAATAGADLQLVAAR